jgi:large subunit ribosomal protein L21
MSFAVIKTGGKQYKVQAGEIIKIERLEDSKPEAKLEFNEVLAYGDDKNLELGEPTISGAKVEADLIKNGKNRTVLIFKKRRRKNSRRKNGHRQQFSLIRINKIFAKDGKIISEAEIKKEASKEIKTQTKEVSK